MNVRATSPSLSAGIEPHVLRDRDRRDPRRDHVGARHDDRQRRAAQPLPRPARARWRSIQWVITGYLLSLAAVIPVTGWAVRRYSARRLYLIALVVFTAGSALCALATTAAS